MSKPLSPRVKPLDVEPTTTKTKTEEEQRILRSMRRAYKKQGLLTEPSIGECYEHGMYYRSPYSRRSYVREYRYLGYDVEIPETKIQATCVKVPKLSSDDFRRTALPQLIRNNPQMKLAEAMKFISAVLKYRRGTFNPDQDKIPLRPGVTINYSNVLLERKPITDEEYNTVTYQLSSQSEIKRLSSPKKSSTVRRLQSPSPPKTTPTASSQPPVPALPPLQTRSYPGPRTGASLQSPRRSPPNPIQGPQERPLQSLI
jgi:hypothetical protein